MTRFESLKTELIRLNNKFIELLKTTGNLSGVSKDSYKNWEKVCNAANRQITEDMVRVAVVGPIKSGKSTFVNSLFHNDHLKRGAGVITSIVTKIRCGNRLRAVISFKAWDEINRDIEQGLTLLPITRDNPEDFRFDLRKEAHREMLAGALDSLRTEQLIVDDSRNLTTVLLSSYLKGYDRVKEIIGPDMVTREYENDAFSEHRTFSGDEILAVYISDIQLEIDSEIWDSSIEIADCQGSDSPNPLHLAMVQDYLSVTNLIVYVISSRTGLRRADIKFLSMIREMGIIDNMLFVVNCDFSEHESTSEFQTLMAKIKEEISLIVPDPEVFTLSALYNLFIARKNSGETGIELSKKDRLRLEQWEDEKEFTELSATENKRFAEVLTCRLTEQRYSLLLMNHLERLAVMISGIRQRIAINRELLTRDSSSAEELISRIRGNQDKTGKVSTMIRSTLDGSVKKVNNEIKREVDRFFDERTGTAVTEIKKFIRNYEHSLDINHDSAVSSGFTASLYLVYQDFKNAVDAFITESVTPKIMGFIRNSEQALAQSLWEMTRPYGNMVENALSEYGSALSEFGITPEMPTETSGQEMPDIESVKSAAGIVSPKATAAISYSARVRAESVVRFGLYNIVSFIRKTLKRQPADKTENEKLALRDGLNRLKKETVGGLTSHFLSYKENLKYQYFLKLNERIADTIFDLHTSRFKAYINDLETVSTLVKEKKEDKEKIATELNAFESEINAIGEMLSSLKQEIAEM